MDATTEKDAVTEKRDALAQLTLLLTLQAALIDRITALLQTRSHPSVDVVAWDHLIAEANFQREQMAERIESLQAKLGIQKREHFH